jgi:hypothetical protein
MHYIDHAHPKVKAIVDAQAILRANRKALFADSYSARRKLDRLRASKAFDKLDRASNHLSEQIRSDKACWVEVR